MVRKLLIVGGGLTGAVAAYRLRTCFGRNVDIECWEYLNDPGGRLATTKEQNVVADVATSVISLDMRKAEIQKMRDLLLPQGHLKEADARLLVSSSERPLGSQWHHYFAPNGTSSLVDFLFQVSGVKVRTNYCVDSCSLDAESWKWHVEASGGKSGGKRHPGTAFDAVVLCNGPPHPGCDRMDNIWGEWQDVIDNTFWDALRNVSWSSCYVITLFLTRDCLEACDHFFGEEGIQRTVNDDLVQYITYESRKRQNLTGKKSSSVVLVCHTTAEAMWYYKRAQCVQAVQEQVLQKYLQLPNQLSRKMVHRCHSRCWGKCQVKKTISMIMGMSITHWASDYMASPPLVICGDYFVGPTCSDAIVSATAAAEAIAAMLTPDVPAEVPAAWLEEGNMPFSSTSITLSPSRRWADEPLEEADESNAPRPAKTLRPVALRRWGRNCPRKMSPSQQVV